MAPIVGVLGGMGPAATADFYTKLIASTPAEKDQEHLRVVIWADPTVPDRSSAILGSGEDPSRVMAAGLRSMAEAGVTLLAAPCNTAHAFLPPLASESGLDLVNIIDVTADALARQLLDGSAAGLLATQGTIAAGLYHHACTERGLRLVVPSADGQDIVNRAINTVKAGHINDSDRHALEAIVESLIRQGTNAVIAGCTELSLLLEGADLPLPVLDPANLLAQEVVSRARATR